MKILFIQIAFLLAITPALADDQPAPPLVGSVVAGANAYLSRDGELTISSPGRIKLENGRELERRGEKWAFVDAADSNDIKTLTGLDFSAYARDYIGQRVRIVGGNVYNADSQSGILQIPGSYVRVDFDSLPRDQVKALIRDCAGIMTGPECRFTVVGVVGRSYSGFGLTEVSLLAPEKPVPAQRRKP
jgi:hypothetical protein